MEAIFRIQIESDPSEEEEDYEDKEDGAQTAETQAGFRLGSY